MEEKSLPIGQNLLIRIRQTGIKIFHISDALFPETPIYSRTLSSLQKIALLIAFTIVFGGIGFLMPANGFIGFDWINFFGIGRVPPFYPPWTKDVVVLLSWPLLVGLGTAAFSLSVLQRAAHRASLIAAFLSLPFLWTMFLGQLEGIALLGLLGLPWLAPLALIKPQITIFAFGSKRSYLLAFLVVLFLSFLIYGPWWNTMLNVEAFYGEGRYPQNVGLGWWGLPAFLATVWFSRGDMDMLMLSGCFITPHLIPYNIMPVIPAISRLRPRDAFVAAFISWFPILFANYFESWGWWTFWVFPVWVWVNLAILRHRKKYIPVKK
jgi:hypothetical protein